MEEKVDIVQPRTEAKKEGSVFAPAGRQSPLRGRLLLSGENSRQYFRALQLNRLQSRWVQSQGFQDGGSNLRRLYRGSQSLVSDLGV